MKKAIAALAAGVFAVGVSAQAEEVKSAEYAVITIPITTGQYSMVGISVAADEENTIASLISGIDATDDVLVWLGDGYSENTKGSYSATNAMAVAFSAESTGYLYELGATVTNSSVVVSCASEYSLVASPFAQSFALNDLAFSTTGSSKFSEANKIHVWNGEGYDVYWFKKNKNAEGGVWKRKFTTSPDPSTLRIGAGRGVFVEFGATENSSAPKTVTFTASAE